MFHMELQLKKNEVTESLGGAANGIVTAGLKVHRLVPEVGWYELRDDQGAAHANTAQVWP
ncbi:hypothetical protein DRN98_04515 [Methanosarcinales archaeon]|nr:MAG: hypothetical protein DRN98_04515 [Methanosarcinales archaeon]